MRQKNSLKNLFFGVFCFVVTTILGMVIPRFFLLSYGSEVNGMIKTVGQVFGYFSLFEAGVGGAAMQALYGPVARQDHDAISAILSAVNKFYRRTGLLYLAGVLIFAFVFPFTLDTTIETYVIVGVILLQGSTGIIKYFVTSKMQLLMKADGKNYVLSNFGLVISIVSDGARILLMSLGFGVLWVQAVFCVIDLCQILFVVFYTRRHYPWLDMHHEPNYAAVSQKNNVIVHQISGLLFSNTDNLILTYFVGLTAVSVYGMNAMPFGMAANIVGVIGSSFNFAMGQLFNTDREQFKKVQEAFETYYLTLSFALFCLVFIFIMPFLRLYTVGVSDANYVDRYLPVLFLIDYLLGYGRSTSGGIIDYAGHYKQTQWRSVAEAAINLVVSLIAVNFLGIYGVLLGTIVAHLYRTNDVIVYANRTILGRSPRPTYRRWFRNILLVIACSAVGFLIFPRHYSGYGALLAAVVPAAIALLAIFFGVNTLCEKEARRTAWEYLHPILQAVFHRKKSKTS